MQNLSILSSAQLLTSLEGWHADWPHLSALLGNSYLFVLATTILAYFIISMCLVFKYVPYLLNDFRNRTNNEIPDIVLKLWLGFILIIPGFFDAGPAWFILWWFSIFWGYANRPEKRLAVVFVFLILMSGWIAHVGGGLITYTRTQVNKEIFLVERASDSSQDVLELTTWVRGHSADAEPMNTQAITEIRKGNYAVAVSLLTYSLNLEPDNPRYYNHLGIALAGMEKYKEAIKAFSNASTLDPKNILYHYNISKVYLATYNLYEAEQAIDRASKIDPKHTSELLSREANTKKAKFIMENVPALRLLARQMKPSDELRAAADALWYVALGILSRDKALWLGLAILIILFFIGYIPEEMFTKLCSRCGKSFYVGTTSKQGHPMCLQCNWLETKTKKQVTSILQHKIEEIKKYRIASRTRTARMEMIIPGLGSLIGNRTTRGATWLFILSGSMIMMATGGQFMYSFIPSDVDLSIYIRILGAIFAGLLYWRAYKSPPIRLGA